MALLPAAPQASHSYRAMLSAADARAAAPAPACRLPPPRVGRFAVRLRAANGMPASARAERSIFS
ncbi:hypothetical protein ELH19_37420 [Rhizobium ruizarguesonis]|nr:hypothetical protein ELH19_37420 [Rhizobium ruizarguesonis]